MMMRISEIEKQHEFETQHRVICKCGHSILITSRNGRTICTHCHKFVFATPELEKQYRKEEFIKTLKREI